jgi:hypothetical protein
VVGEGVAVDAESGEGDTIMMKHYKEIAGGDWSFAADGEGRVDRETINTACLVDIAHTNREIRDTLRNINAGILALGRDGIHEVIKHESARARRALKQAATKRRKRRAAKKAAQP